MSYQILPDASYLKYSTSFASDSPLTIEDGGYNKSGFNSKKIGFSINESQEIYEDTFGYDSTLTVYVSVSEATANDIETIWISERNAQVLQASKELFFERAAGTVIEVVFGIFDGRGGIVQKSGKRLLGRNAFPANPVLQDG